MHEQENGQGQREKVKQTPDECRARGGPLTQDARVMPPAEDRWLTE